MRPEFFGWLLLLSIFSGYTQSRSIAAVGLPSRLAWLGWPIFAAVMAGLTMCWSVFGFSLPMLYVLTYLFQAVRFLTCRPVHMKNWFLLNLSYANLLTLHLVVIGVSALIQNSSMRALLADPLWRTLSVSVVLLVGIMEDLCFLRWPSFSGLVSSAVQSEEARPFMAFLWFCVGYLLIDSTLCMFEPEPVYPPLFLVGSSSIVMFTLIRFLVHIYALIKNNHLKEEHDRLASRLEATEESADTLRQMAQRDVLTGVFSRRYAMEHIGFLIQKNEPFSLVFLDLDALKKINDTQGHDAGDAYLIAFAKALGSRLRESDLLARVGGDEFVVLMPGCAAGTADERIREIRAGLEREDRGETIFRFSYGVTAFPEGIKDADLLMREADRAMYLDKARRHRRKGAE